MDDELKSPIDESPEAPRQPPEEEPTTESIEEMVMRPPVPQESVEAGSFVPLPEGEPAALGEESIPSAPVEGPPPIISEDTESVSASGGGMIPEAPSEDPELGERIFELPSEDSESVEEVLGASGEEVAASGELGEASVQAEDSVPAVSEQAEPVSALDQPMEAAQEPPTVVDEEVPHKKETAKEETAKEETAKEETAKEETAKEETTKEEATEEEATEEEATEEVAAEPKSENMQWYILKVQSNREDSIRQGLERRVKIAGLERFFGDVIIPIEKVTEVKGGRKRVIKRKLYPGYLVIQMEITDDTWFLVRETPGIGDFTGAAGRPTPMLPHEVARIVSTQEEKADAAPKLKIGFKLGDRVKINEGTFENFEGEVETIDEASGRVTVMINIFGRSTPVELEYWQVESL